MWNDPAEGERRLGEALATFDWSAVEEVTRALAVRVAQDAAPYRGKFAPRVLKSLRRKRRFGAMSCLADAFIQAGLGTHEVRRQYAQALIDQGFYYPGEVVLCGILNDAGSPAGERAEAQGLIGRIYKQLYLGSKAPEHLDKALSAYLSTYETDPDEYLWHGINAAALLKRAGREADAHELARRILAVLREREAESAEGLASWDLATAMEAHLALGQLENAVGRARVYAGCGAADAFEYASTLRQLEEVWRLRDGDALLSILRAALLKREGGEVRIEAAKLEKVFGTDASVSLEWYMQGLERARSIARIEVNGKGFGTGWLVRSEEFFPAQSRRPLLVTNAHVIGPDSPDRYPGALFPNQATVRFQIQNVAVPAGKVVFHSPVNRCDATFLEAPEVSAECLPVDFSGVQVTKPPPRLYIIGHPGGRAIEFSLQDNYLVAAGGGLVHYRTPSEGGSSGSPVFGPVGWKVVALHHAGRKDMPRIDGLPGTYEANEGVLLEAIRAECSS